MRHRQMPTMGTARDVYINQSGSRDSKSSPTKVLFKIYHYFLKKSKGDGWNRGSYNHKKYDDFAKILDYLDCNSHKIDLDAFETIVKKKKFGLIRNDDYTRYKFELLELNKDELKDEIGKFIPFLKGNLKNPVCSEIVFCLKELKNPKFIIAESVDEKSKSKNVSLKLPLAPPSENPEFVIDRRIAPPSVNPEIVIDRHVVPLSQIPELVIAPSSIAPPPMNPAYVSQVLEQEDKDEAGELLAEEWAQQILVDAGIEVEIPKLEIEEKEGQVDASRQLFFKEEEGSGEVRVGELSIELSMEGEIELTVSELRVEERGGEELEIPEPEVERGEEMPRVISRARSEGAEEVLEPGAENLDVHAELAESEQPGLVIPARSEVIPVKEVKLEGKPTVLSRSISLSNNPQGLLVNKEVPVSKPVKAVKNKKRGEVEESRKIVMT